MTKKAFKVKYIYLREKSLPCRLFNFNFVPATVVDIFIFTAFAIIVNLS